MSRLVWKLPELPNMALSTNRRDKLHWGDRRKLTNEENVRWYALLAPRVREAKDAGMEFPFQRARLSFKLTYPDRRSIHDDDNVEGALKVIRDTLMIATNRAPTRWQLGVIVDDNPKHLTMTPPVQESYPGVSETVIEVEAL